MSLPHLLDPSPFPLRSVCFAPGEALIAPDLPLVVAYLGFAGSLLCISARSSPALHRRQGPLWHRGCPNLLAGIRDHRQELCSAVSHLRLEMLVSYSNHSIHSFDYGLQFLAWCQDPGEPVRICRNQSYTY